MYEQPQWGMQMPTISPQWSNFLFDLLRKLEQGIPADEVMLSLLAQAAADPSLRDIAALDLFYEHLHQRIGAHLAAAGYTRRILSGDLSPQAITGLRQQLGLIHRSQVETKNAFKQVMTNENAKRNEAVQVIYQLSGLVEQLHHELMPSISILAPEMPTAQQ